MNDELDLKAIGRRIRAQREQMHLTREEFAEKLGVSSKFCADIEYGVKGMSISTLLRLSNLLELSTDYILKGYGTQLGDDSNRILKESIMQPLNTCSGPQLRRIEQLLKVFVAAVHESAEGLPVRRMIDDLDVEIIEVTNEICFSGQCYASVSNESGRKNSVHRQPYHDRRYSFFGKSYSGCFIL